MPSNWFWPFILITSQTKSYLAVRLKDEDLRDSRQEAAKHFIHTCLYGSGSRRTTGNSLVHYVCLSCSFSQWQSNGVWFFPLVNKFLSLNNKRLPVKKAAAQFLNSTWGKRELSSVGFSSFYKGSGFWRRWVMIVSWKIYFNSIHSCKLDAQILFLGFWIPVECFYIGAFCSIVGTQKQQNAKRFKKRWMANK